jgi:RNA 3'-terminal phosphate cyclase (ATP)
MIELNGATGEGGGQILRSALALSMLTGEPFRIEAIRAGRKKPGLLRQHLTAVQACARICNAQIEGAALGSLTLTFAPQETVAGRYEFAIGSAGSACLVAQSILPALLMADAPSEVIIRGGTHNPMAPSATFLQRTFFPAIARMGFHAELELTRYGFFPAGGGEIVLKVQPHSNFQALHLGEAKAKPTITAEAIVAGVPTHVAQRELFTAGQRLGLIAEHVRGEEACKTNDDRAEYFRLFNDERLKVIEAKSQGPGNALSLFLAWQDGNVTHTETVTGLGEHGLSAEVVAKNASKAALEIIASGTMVGEHLADQLLLPMAIVAWKAKLNSSFDTYSPSLHTTTNAEVIEKFLPVEFDMTKGNDKRVRVICNS